MARQLFGVHPLLEALRAKPQGVRRIQIVEGASSPAVAEILERARQAGIRVERVRKDVIERAAPKQVHQGVVAELVDFAYVDLEDVLTRPDGAKPLLLILLDGIQDPHNLGALIRSAHALGADGVVIPQDRASGVTPIAAKASAGAIEHLPVARVVNLTRAIEQIKEAGVWTSAAVLDGDRAPWQVDLRDPSALVIGAEGSGVRPGVAKACDFRVRIPMAAGFGSMNASAAGATLIYEALRQRTAPSSPAPKRG